MQYRDEKTKRDQKVLNSYESLIYDVEMEEEEDNFRKHMTEEESEWLHQHIADIKQYIEDVNAKKILFEPNTMKKTVEEVKEFLQVVDKRIMDEMDEL